MAACTAAFCYTPIYICIYAYNFSFFLLYICSLYLLTALCTSANVLCLLFFTSLLCYHTHTLHTHICCIHISCYTLSPTCYTFFFFAFYLCFTYFLLFCALLLSYLAHVYFAFILCSSIGYMQLYVHLLPHLNLLFCNVVQSIVMMVMIF